MSTELPSMDMIKGCLAAYDLDVSGTHEQVHARLGAHLVALKLGEKKACNKGKRTSTTRNVVTPKKPRPTRADWFNYLRNEKEKVKAELGLSDRVSIMKEVGRRWKVRKAQGETSSAPLLLTYQGGIDSDEYGGDVESDDDGLIQALAELPPDEVNAALGVHGIEIDADPATNVARLARALGGRGDSP